MAIIDTVEDGVEMVVWIGQHASPEFVMNVFGVNSQAEINVDSVCIYIYFVDKECIFIALKKNIANTKLANS